MRATIPDIPEHVLARVASGLLIGALGLTLALVVAAFAIHGWAAFVERRRSRRAERWTPRLMALLDGEIEAEAFARAIWPHQRADMLRFLVTFAVRLRGGDRHRIAEAAAPLRALAHRYLQSPSPEWRAFGAHALGVLSVRAPVVTLGTALRDPSRRVGLVAARALSRSADVRAARVMLTGLSRFGGAHTASVASLLTAFGVQGGMPITEALVHPRTDARARLAAIEALRRLSFVPAAPAARALLVRPGIDRETQAALLRLLGEIGAAADTAAVRRFCDDPDDVLRINAITALGVLQSGPDDESRLRRARLDPNGWVALRASEALGETQGPDPAPSDALPPSPAR